MPLPYSRIFSAPDPIRRIYNRAMVHWRRLTNPAISQSAADKASEVSTFQARLRVRISKPLFTDQTSLWVQIAGRPVEITSGLGTGKPLADADWLILKGRGFASKTEAENFGRQLKAVVGLAGVCCFQGIDLGNDEPRMWIDEGYARAIGLIAAHERTRPNVHGLTVLEDDPNIRFPVLKAEATVRANPDDFTNSLEELSGSALKTGARAWNGVLLINQAMLNPQALAQLVLAISAVEALGQHERWTKEQKALLRRMAARAATDVETSEQERQEVAEAIKRSFRIGLRQGVKRVLAELNLAHLIGEWDRIYNARSGIFHGTLDLTEPETVTLAAEAIRLCGHIILALAQRDGLVLPSITFVHFPAMATEQR